MLEESHYYPYGLTQVGISSQAVGKLENKIKYDAKELQHKEFSDGSGLDWEDYGARMYNPQIAKWNGIDPSSEKYYGQSPFIYAGNNPILFVDYNGNNYGVSVNHDTKTITISAEYLVSSKDQSSAQNSGVNPWNEQSGKFVFVVGKGKDAVAYTVCFELKTTVDNGQDELIDENTGQPRPGETCAAMDARDDNSGTVNSYETVPDGALGTDKDDRKIDGDAGSQKISVEDSKKNTSVSTHEVGHTLGLGHSSGLMAKSAGSAISSGHIEEILKGVGIGGINKNLDPNVARGNGTLINGSNIAGLQKGRVMTIERFQRIQARAARQEQKHEEREKKKKDKQG